MRKLLLLSSVVVLMFTACKKEPSFEDPNRTPGSGGGNNARLVRMGTRNGNDSITSDYSYDAAGRLVSITHAGTVNGQPIELQQIIRRNAANMITATVLKSALFLAAGFATDSLVTLHQVDASTGRFVRSVLHYVLDNEVLSDSAIYQYDANGKLSAITGYIGDSSGYALDSKSEYTYAGNNLASAKSYSHNGSAFVLDQTETFEYDNKVNPMQSVAEAPVLSMVDFYPANNKTKRTTVTVDPAETVVTSVAYTYNSNNLPTKSVGTAAGMTSTVSYYYQ